MPRKLENSEHLPFLARVGKAFQHYFITGLAALFPVAVTLYLVRWIFKFADGLLIHFQIPGLGLLVTLLIILAVGFLSTHFFGRVLFPTVEALFSRLPLISKIYPAVKQLTKFLFDRENGHSAFRRVVLVEYPRAGIYSLAFITNEDTVTLHGESKKMLTLLIPVPPSPFTGPIAFMLEEEVLYLTMTIEEALKLVVSGGVVSSPLKVAEKPAF